MRVFAYKAILLALGLLLACGTKQPIDPVDEADNMPPQCVITSPSEGDALVVGDINISVEASDSDGHITSVKFYIDNDRVYIDRDPPYNYTDTTFWRELGECSIKAVAQDNDTDVTECEIAATLILFMPVKPHPDTLYVPADYSSIQDAVDNSQDGDVIMVADGVYDEHIDISHPLSLIGNGENTIIDDNGIRVESDYVVIKKIKVNQRSSYQSYYAGAPGLTIRNSAFVLIDSVFVRGGQGNYFFDSEYPDWPLCTPGGPGVRATNSSNVIIKNSNISGGVQSDVCWAWAPGGKGADIGSSTDLFFINTHLIGLTGGDGVRAWDNSYVGIRYCTVEVDNYSEQYVTDETSTIIFP